MAPSRAGSFSSTERRNIAIYIIGIMFYKIGLESFNGAIVSLAADRFEAAHTFGKIGALNGLNQAMQVVGSILVGPLVKAFPARSVMTTAILIFGFISVLFLIIDAGTGGKTKIANGGQVKYGKWDPDGLFPLYMIAGISHGMVELIRRIIPCDIVGGDVKKLRKMDAIVHIMYEAAGTGGAILSVKMIEILGNNFSSLITPPLFAFAGLTWMFIDTLGHHEEEQREDNSLDDMPKRTFWQSLGSVYYLESVIRGAKAFGRSTYQGAIICFSHRRFIWLLPGYSFALYGHRYLEGTIAPAIAKRIMDDSSYSQIMVSGSNLGELVGAFFVLVSANAIKTPLPFIRFDALALLLVWGLPAYSHHIQPHKTVYAWRIAGMLIPISMGWAAGDVSLSAFIQSSLASIENTDSQVSPLGSVMSFLYSSYIIIYAILGAVLGSYIDKVFKEDGNIYRALVNVGGVHFTILSVIIIAATLVPLGALRLNPRLTKNEKETDGSDVELRGDEREQETPTQLDFNHPVHQYRQVRVRAIDL